MPLIEPDIFWGHIAVDKSPLVQVCEPAAELTTQPQKAKRQRARLPQMLSECSAAQVLEYDVLGRAIRSYIVVEK